MTLWETKEYGRPHEKVVIVFGTPGTKQSHLWLLGQLFSAHHFHAIIYTLSPSFLSDSPLTVRHHFLTLTNDALKRIKLLPKKSQKNVTVLGNSMGTIPAFLLAKQSPSVTKIVANLSGSSLAVIVRSWIDRKRLPYQLSEKKSSLITLEKAWGDISPGAQISLLKKKKILLYMATSDEIIPFSQQEKLLQQLEDAHIKTQAIVNTKHHNLISRIVNLLRFDIYIRFME